MIACNDRHTLARAVALAQAAVVPASPNPGVGCVLVADGEIVGEGATQEVGGPHAEVVALRAAGLRAAGATAYVTLEPCAHEGRTPACTDALRSAGVARVVYAHPDPNPVARGGAGTLRAAGVAVDGPLDPDDLLFAAVRGQLEGFLSVVTQGRPHLTLKLAQTSDGRLSAGPDQRWLTGDAARRAVHRWRASRDAVIVGSGTILADDPSLDAREVPVHRQPRAVVLDSRLRTPPRARVVRPGTIVVTGPSAPPSRAAQLRARGVEVLTVGAAPDGHLDLLGALRDLARVGITSILAEPGATLANALVGAQLVDLLVLHVALELGDDAPRRAVPSPPGTVWRTIRSGGAGADLILHLIPGAVPVRAEEAA